MKNMLSSPTFNEIRPFVPAYLALLGFSFFTPLLFLAIPLFTHQVLDRVSASRSLPTLYVLAAITVLMILMLSILNFVRKKALERIAVSIDERLGRTLFDALHREGSASRLAPSSFADFNIVRDFLHGNSVGAVFDAIWAPMFIIVVFMVHWIFGVFALGAMVVTLCLALLNHFLVRHDNRRFQQASLREAEFGNAVSRNSESVRALGMLPALRNRWHALHETMLGWHSASSSKTVALSAVARFMNICQSIFAYTIGGILFINNELSLASVVLVVIILNRGLGPLEHVLTNWRVYTNFATACRRLDEVLIDAENRPSKVSLPELSGPLTLTRVFGFAPGSEKLVINDVSFTLAQARILGVVGPSGAGKSCLARLLVGIWSPRRGSVSVGDHDLSHWNQDDLGRHLGYMAQDVELLPGTVGENIARFSPELATDSTKLIAAAELAGIQDLIKTLPDGYNTQVGERGHVLSGGQRNRIALARAVYGNPSLVVLDEPNSNLDSLGEQNLVNMLHKIQSRGATVVVITHKLNLLSHCDDILVLNAGTVQAFGSREQIVSRIPRLKASPALTVIEGTLEGRRS